jgi:hypothetical protein
MRHSNYSDETRININEQWELEWWPWRLGISRKELLAAVKNVGPQLTKVKNYLSSKYDSLL